MMLNRRHYLTLFALLLAGSAILLVTKRSTDASDTSPASDSKQAISSSHTEPNPAGVVALPEVSVDSAQKKITPNPRIGRLIDWDKYPGTLDSQIHRALDNHDGEMAMDLADKLRECKIVSVLLDPSYSSQIPPPQDTAAQRAEVRRVQENQRIDANCQTVVGDRDQLRLHLLDVAIEKKVIGAAIESFYLDVRRPDVLQGVVQDAQAGDISSLTCVAYRKPVDFEISADTQRAIRYALEVASDDPDVGKKVRPYLELAERASVPVGGEASPKFDSSNLSDNVRNEGKAIAERIVSRIKRGGQ